MTIPVPFEWDIYNAFIINKEEVPAQVLTSGLCVISQVLFNFHSIRIYPAETDTVKMINDKILLHHTSNILETTSKPL